MIKINAVGDMFFGDYTISLGFGIRSSIYKYGYNHHFKYVENELRDADIVFGNLETVLSDNALDVNNIKSIICRGDSTFVEVLKHASFDSLNIANNHILQHGENAFIDTINTLITNGIDVIGIRDGGVFFCKPVIKEINGRRLGILGYSLVNEYFYKGEPLYAYGVNSKINNDIRKLREETDFVIVSCHWGIEYINKPSNNIRQMAKEMIDSGASVILGHHPHVVQGVERYKDSIIFYSLGNFLFDFLWSRRTRESFIAKIYIYDDKIDYELTPISINNRYQIVPMEERCADSYRNYVDSLSRGLEKDGYIDLEDSNYNYFIKAYKENIYNQASKLLYIFLNIYRLDLRFIEYFLKKCWKIQ